MRLKCDNGFYKFYPNGAHELALLSAQGFEAVKYDDFFTLPLLAELMAYSIEGADYHGVTASATFSGTPELVILKNLIVYDLESQTLKKVDEIDKMLDYSVSDFIAFNEFPQCGGFMEDNNRLRGFSGYWDLLGSGIITAERVEYYVN